MPATSVRPGSAGSRAAAVDGFPVAASSSVRAILSRPPQPATVLSSPIGAIYLQTAGGEMVAVSAPGAVRLPISAVAGDRRDLPDRIAAGSTARVGGGRIEAGPLSAYVVRWWDPRPAIPHVHRDVLAHNLARLAGSAGAPPDGVGFGRLTALTTALAGDAALHPAARALVGLGPGLTPAGDDVLVGLLSALACLDAGQSERVARVVLAAARGRTGDLSLALLRQAAQGHCIGPVGSFLRALAGHGDLYLAERRLLQVGHSSGAALREGVLLGVEAVVGRRR